MLTHVYSADDKLLIQAHVGGRRPVTRASEEVALASGNGIFRVWSVDDIFSQRAPHAHTPSAAAAFAAHDSSAVELITECQPPGMPNAILNPYPMQFIDEGNRIVMKIEEWDAMRTIHMDTEAPENVEPTPMGYSVGRWEGETLVVETTGFNNPLLDERGTPMSSDAVIHERYSLKENGTLLSLEITVTDPVNLREPTIWDMEWVIEADAEVKPFEADCLLPNG